MILYSAYDRILLAVGMKDTAVRYCLGRELFLGFENVWVAFYKRWKSLTVSCPDTWSLLGFLFFFVISI